MSNNPTFLPTHKRLSMPLFLRGMFSRVNPSTQPRCRRCLSTFTHVCFAVSYSIETTHASSRYSQTIHCRICKRPVETVVNHEVGNGAYVMGGLIAAVGMWVGYVYLNMFRCCLIPCLMDDCKDAVHYCPNCGTQVAKKKFLFE